jgi:hypothetical protein
MLGEQCPNGLCGMYPVSSSPASRIDFDFQAFLVTWVCSVARSNDPLSGARVSNSVEALTERRVGADSFY